MELFDGEVLTRLNNPKRGCVVIIAHRVNEDDLSGHLLQQGGWKHLKLPLVAMRRRKHKLPDGGIWVREKGELLQPDAFTRAAIERLQLARRPGFETLYQQIRVAPSCASSRSILELSRPCWFRYPSWGSC